MARTEVRGGQILDASVSLTADVTGVLPTANGGTGASSLAAAGIVTGPSSATDNAIARFDATTGKLVQDSATSVSDVGSLTLGVGVSGGTTTPTLLDLGANYGTSAVGSNANLKVQLYTGYGIGISGGMLEIQSPNIIGNFAGGNLVLKLTNTDATVEITAGTASKSVVTCGGTQSVTNKTFNNTNTVNAWACAPNVLSISQTVTAGCSTYIPDFLEIGAGVPCEIGAESVLEIG